MLGKGTWDEECSKVERIHKKINKLLSSGAHILCPKKKKEKIVTNPLVVA